MYTKDECRKLRTSLCSHHELLPPKEQKIDNFGIDELQEMIIIPVKNSLAEFIRPDHTITDVFIGVDVSGSIPTIQVKDNGNGIRHDDFYDYVTKIGAKKRLKLSNPGLGLKTLIACSHYIMVKNSHDDETSIIHISGCGMDCECEIKHEQYHDVGVEQEFTVSFQPNMDLFAEDFIFGDESHYEKLKMMLMSLCNIYPEIHVNLQWTKPDGEILQKCCTNPKIEAIAS